MAMWSRVAAFAAVLLIGCGAAMTAVAQAPSNRIALVIGNGAYPGGANPTAPNDAGLVAQTLTAAGFDVTGTRDLDGDGIRRAFRDFVEHAAQLGPEGVAFVYLAGYAVQFEGDNYYVPVDATLARDTDVPIQAIRVSDLTRALAGVPALAKVVVIDGAYRTPFGAGTGLAGGLALVDPEPETLIAFNAAPGTLGPSSTESYGVYGQAVAEMLRQGGVPVQEVFDRIRLRVNDITRGADVPWSLSKLSKSFVFLQASPDAPPPSAAPLPYEALEQRPIREFPVKDAYNVAVARDTFQGYQDYLGAFPDSPYGPRVKALLAARREALTWRRTVNVGSGNAYWSYLRRYPQGPHAADARRRLRALSAALQPPPDFNPIDYDVPPPPQEEFRYVDAPVIVFERDELPPPPPPVYFLPPEQVEIYRLPPPPPSIGPGFLPIPIPVAIPYGRPFFRPGRLQPLRGSRGSYAEPEPFMQTPRGGLAPRRGPGRDGDPDHGGLPPRPTVPPPNRPGEPRPGVDGRPGTPLPGSPLPGAPSQPQPTAAQLRRQLIEQREQERLQKRPQADQARQQAIEDRRQKQEQLRQQKLQTEETRKQPDQQRPNQDRRKPDENKPQGDPKPRPDQPRDPAGQDRQKEDARQQQKQQLDQQRQQKIEERQQQQDKQRQQQIQQKQQLDQQRQQQLQERQQQQDKQRQQQEQRQQQIQQRQQLDQQRQQQLQDRLQQQNQQRQQQEQRQQQIQQRQQIDQQRQPHGECGRPGQPPCR